MQIAYLTADHELLHEQVARYLAREVEPFDEQFAAVEQPEALTDELANEVTAGCQQLHGGMGFMHGTAIERLWRDARVLAIGGGATEVMLDEAAKRY